MSTDYVERITVELCEQIPILIFLHHLLCFRSSEWYHWTTCSDNSSHLFLGHLLRKTSTRPVCSAITPNSQSSSRAYIFSLTKTGKSVKIPLLFGDMICPVRFLLFLVIGKIHQIKIIDALIDIFISSQADVHLFESVVVPKVTELTFIVGRASYQAFFLVKM